MAPVTQHVLDNPGALSERAWRFLAAQSRRAVPADRDHAWYVCTDLDGRQVPGPHGGLTRLELFFARFGGLVFGTERPALSDSYRFDLAGESGWTQVGSGDWWPRSAISTGGR
jgi:hypothetical protein